MRTLKRIGLAVVLALTLGTSAMAGIIECPPAPEPAPEPSPQQAGIIECPPSAATTDQVVAFALDVLLSVF